MNSEYQERTEAPIDDQLLSQLTRYNMPPTTEKGYPFYLVAAVYTLTFTPLLVFLISLIFINIFASIPLPVIMGIAATLIAFALIKTNRIFKPIRKRQKKETINQGDIHHLTRSKYLHFLTKLFGLHIYYPFYYFIIDPQSFIHNREN